MAKNVKHVRKKKKCQKTSKKIKTFQNVKKSQNMKKDKICSKMSPFGGVVFFLLLWEAAFFTVFRWVCSRFSFAPPKGGEVRQRHAKGGGNQAAPPNQREEKNSPTQKRGRKAVPRGNQAAPPNKREEKNSPTQKRGEGRQHQAVRRFGDRGGSWGGGGSEREGAGPRGEGEGAVPIGWSRAVPGGANLNTDLTTQKRSELLTADKDRPHSRDVCPSGRWRIRGGGPLCPPLTSEKCGQQIMN